jgi:hypothetical protein
MKIKTQAILDFDINEAIKREVALNRATNGAITSKEELIGKMISEYFELNKILKKKKSSIKNLIKEK